MSLITGKNVQRIEKYVVHARDAHRDIGLLAEASLEMVEYFGPLCDLCDLHELDNAETSFRLLVKASNKCINAVGSALKAVLFTYSFHTRVLWSSSLYLALKEWAGFDAPVLVEESSWAELDSNAQNAHGFLRESIEHIAAAQKLLAQAQELVLNHDPVTDIPILRSNAAGATMPFSVSEILGILQNPLREFTTRIGVLEKAWKWEPYSEPVTVNESLGDNDCSDSSDLGNDFHSDYGVTFSVLSGYSTLDSIETYFQYMCLLPHAQRNLVPSFLSIPLRFLTAELNWERLPEYIPWLSKVSHANYGGDNFRKARNFPKQFNEYSNLKRLADGIVASLQCVVPLLEMKYVSEGKLNQSHPTVDAIMLQALLSLDAIKSIVAALSYVQKFCVPMLQFFRDNLKQNDKVHEKYILMLSNSALEIAEDVLVHGRECLRQIANLLRDVEERQTSRALDEFVMIPADYIGVPSYQISIHEVDSALYAPDSPLRYLHTTIASWIVTWAWADPAPALASAHVEKKLANTQSWMRESRYSVPHNMVYHQLAFYPNFLLRLKAIPEQYTPFLSDFGHHADSDIEEWQLKMSKKPSIVVTSKEDENGVGLRSGSVADGFALWAKLYFKDLHPVPERLRSLIPYEKLPRVYVQPSEDTVSDPVQQQRLGALFHFLARTDTFDVLPLQRTMRDVYSCVRVLCSIPEPRSELAAAIVTHSMQFMDALELTITSVIRAFNFVQEFYRLSTEPTDFCPIVLEDILGEINRIIDLAQDIPRLIKQSFEMLQSIRQNISLISQNSEIEEVIMIQTYNVWNERSDMEEIEVEDALDGISDSIESLETQIAKWMDWWKWADEDSVLNESSAGEITLWSILWPGSMQSNWEALLKYDKFIYEMESTEMYRVQYLPSTFKLPHGVTAHYHPQSMMSRQAYQWGRARKDKEKAKEDSKKVGSSTSSTLKVGATDTKDNFQTAGTSVNSKLTDASGKGSDSRKLLKRAGAGGDTFKGDWSF